MKLEKTKQELDELLDKCGLSKTHPDNNSDDRLKAEIRNAVAYAGHRSGEKGVENDFYRTAFLELLDGLFQ